LQESVASIQANLLYVDKIITDLQDYAKNQKPCIEKINFDRVAEEVLLLVQIPNNLKVVIEKEKGFPDFASDHSMVKRILFNLVNNAVQAMPEGGTLTISANSSCDKVFLCVEDTGVGIPEDIKSKLFLPMVTTKSKGQGFGLAVVKRLVEALDGTVTFESHQGQGTKFTVRLPKDKLKNAKQLDS
jgi:signal transduction histidine kinase